MAESDFAPWLSRRLEAMQVDAEVYGSYLAGILGEEDDSDEEKEEAMRDVLSAVVAEEDSLDSICREILRKWREMDHLSKEKRRLLNGSRDEVQVLASMIEQQAQLVVQHREVTREERQRKEALLAQYATVEEAEDEESEETEGATAAKPAGVTDKSKSLFRNTNAETVAEKQRLQREQAREDSQRKKEQDKTQREKDKVQKQEKKDEKRKKAQKVERRR